MVERSRLSLLAALVTGALTAVVAAPADARDRYDRHRRRPPPPRHRRPVYVRRRPVYVAPPPPVFIVGRRWGAHHYGRGYRVYDWRGHGLPPPRRGAFWVRHGGRYAMVSSGGMVLRIWN